MTIFEYFMVLLSVVLSLSLAQLVTGIGELVRAGRSVRWSATYVMWVGIGFAVILDLWTSLWLVRDVPRWSLLSFLLFLVSSTTIYLATLWMLPRDPAGGTPAQPLDLHTFAIDARRLFIGALMAYLASGGVLNVLLLPAGHFDLANYAFLGPMLVILALAWWSANRHVQRIVPAIFTVLFIVYFAVYFRTIG